ncbi:odorant receptor 13a-like [Ceratina calcarata]|uniref:Odorant receptor n=1 Tax=Ceratina calcarata TaxID=156304 RepID=A0AAJ7JFL2_9HYME|nr:odorant receptor 13a-like [Ceratina calcarata]XP_026674951.1 odorant receptor 13a-like [Ceratina calcarata]
MSFFYSGDTSIGLTSIYMKLVGLWMVANGVEKRIRNITLIYTLSMLIFAVAVMVVDMCYSCGDFSACVFAVCTVLSSIVPFIKIIILYIHKDEFFHLILYLERNFLHADYNDYERKILFGCKRQCTILICLSTLLTQFTVICYIIKPIIANISRNETENRVLPFNLWVDLPLTVTPYYEITFCIQTLSAYHVGVSFFCFDNCLCIINLHTASQFRILQYRLANMPDLKCEGKQQIEKSSSSNYSDNCYILFKKYTRQHQALLAYCEIIEKVFTEIILAELLTFSLFICLDGFQVLMPGASLTTRFIFSFHLIACLCQLLMLTYSCDRIIQESANVRIAVYNGPWVNLPLTTSGMQFRKDLIFFIMRSSEACCLTAKGFVTVSLETYTKVLSTAVSYFTLLSQSEEASRL